MALRLTLKPNERVIIGGTAIRNGDQRAEFWIECEVPVLRESDILSPQAVRTPCERVYLALELLYVDPARAETHLATYHELVADVKAAAPSLTPRLDVMEVEVEQHRLYQALRSARQLLEDERGILARAR
ncbi:MAG: flagellar protein FlbT [Candidatus Eisenbacteria bacterium]|uniref:Flagellar protein FlbT n=1 Tax=Eiseniibacteriota bacterium TaxID=2212470 RepID=A0A849SH29_UNCEI|nr:flagellar protein FlbT [Candidatus Eisenbacteria bacterium]